MNHYKKKHILIVYIFFFFSNLTCAQSEEDLKYMESNFKELGKGKYAEYDYVLTYRSIEDTNLVLRKIFLDSTYTDTVIKAYYHKDFLNGPYEYYFLNKISSKGFKKQGRDDGERLTYNVQGFLVERAFFSDGVKIGIWEEFNSYGTLSEKIYYNSSGKITKREIYNKDGTMDKINEN